MIADWVAGRVGDTGLGDTGSLPGMRLVIARGGDGDPGKIVKITGTQADKIEAE
jgi:hypothetical protein